MLADGDDGGVTDARMDVYPSQQCETMTKNMIKLPITPWKTDTEEQEHSNDHETERYNVVAMKQQSKECALTDSELQLGEK
jgi:hypothetical protein